MVPTRVSRIVESSHKPIAGPPGFGVRRQSAAATALWARLHPKRQIDKDAGSWQSPFVKRSLETPCFSRRTQRVALWVAICLPLYVLSIGPVAWATNDAFHPRYLPEEVNMIYLPLAPVAKGVWISQVLYWYTAVVWGGFPAGYTTL
jgi:hypothetical protein